MEVDLDRDLQELIDHDKAIERVSLHSSRTKILREVYRDLDKHEPFHMIPPWLILGDDIE